MIFPTRTTTISSTETPPVALSVAGSDSGGGAGIQADLKAMTWQGVHACTAITALTAQNSMGVDGIESVPADFVEKQILSVENDFGIDATKTGMLHNASIIDAVSRHLDFLRPLVVDPVMVAESGDPLLEREAEESLIETLIPESDLITPNWLEAKRLAERIGINPSDDPGQLAGFLMESLEETPVLLKGGHTEESQAVDRLARPDGSLETFEADWVETNNTHGAGCIYSSLITANLARDKTLTDAVGIAKRELTRGLREGFACGRGPGTLNFLK